METIKSPRIYRFVEELCKPEVKGNATLAAINAGYASGSAQEAAARLLSFPVVVNLVQQRMTQLAEETSLDIRTVLRRWLDVATADPSKLQRVRRLNCRHCWGINHEYRWQAWEYAEHAAQSMDQGELPQTMKGGDGFRRTDDPNPDCPRCEGEGVEDVYTADMSTLTGPERALFAGIKMTRTGPEVQMHSQPDAWDNIRDYLGMIVKRSELTGKDGRPLYPGGKLPMVDEVLPTDPKALEVAYRELTRGM